MKGIKKIELEKGVIMFETHRGLSWEIDVPSAESGSVDRYKQIRDANAKELRKQGHKVKCSSYDQMWKKIWEIEYEEGDEK